MGNIDNGIEHYRIAASVKCEVGKVIYESLKNMTSRFVVRYCGNCFRSNAPFEVRIAKLITTAIILEPYGEVFLAVACVVYLFALALGKIGIDTS